LNVPAVPRILIVGGGVMGAATACFLARDHGLAATVLERDLGFARASSSLSASSIRQQFSTTANIRLSLWSLAFLRRAGQELAVGSDAPQIGLREPGYLYLADSEAAAAGLRLNHALQTQQGADIALLEPDALAQRFAWLRTQDLRLGSLGLSGEGWFDGPALHQAFKRKAAAHGARFVQAEVAGFESQGDAVLAAKLQDGSLLPADVLLITAGAWSAPLAAALGVQLPVAAKKRDVFVFDAPAPLPGCPLIIDPSGFWLRPEGRGFLCGASPRQPWPGDPDEPPLEAIDHGLFEEVIWPAMAQRVPALEALRLRGAWAGYYEMNTFDHNGLAGPLPGWRNAFTACGFSGHGMQQAPVVGAGLAAGVAASLGLVAAECGAGEGAGRGGGPALEPPRALIAALDPQRIGRDAPLREANVIG
jgi:FAD-dependent oxidoreductase domain-containing protein 1